jgi:outer membrane protein insertion porin family
MAVAVFLDEGRVAVAQEAPLTEVDSETQVRAISFRFVDTQTFPASRLKEHISHTERGGMVGLRQIFGFLPFIDRVGVHPFSPVELARDAVRLERFYERSGFLFANVDWRVRLDGPENLVTILFTIQEGPPLVIASLDYRGADDRLAREHLVPELQEEWERFKRRAELQEGERLDGVRLIELEEAALSWTRNHGYPFSRVNATTRVDTLASEAHITINVEPGPRARIGSIEVEGNETVSDRVILRELPFTEGDIFSQRNLIRGQRDIFGLNIIRIAIVDVPPQPQDSIVDIRVRVREHLLHAVTAQAGYMTESGLIGQVEWKHRNFLGDARTFTANIIANTGWAATIPNPDRRFRANVNLHQPYVFNRHFEATTAAFVEHRDDVRDVSRAFGGDVTLLYERGPLRNAATSFEFEDRRLLEPPVDPLVIDWVITGAPVFLPDDEEGGAALDPDVSRSVISFRGNFGTLDNHLDPRRGYLLRPAVETTIPFPYTRLDYRRARLTASGYLPAGERFRFAARGSIGRLFPGPTPASEEEAFFELLRLRDAVFLAGGSGDVRGWATGMMGPKVLDLPTGWRPDSDPDDLDRARYFPYGGTMRMSGTGEARFDISQAVGVFGFVDAGRVWSPQPEFQVPDDNPLFDAAYDNPNRVFVGAGGGVIVGTPIGGIQVALGYKVNPSFFDVRSPDDVAQALADELRANPGATAEELRRAVVEGVEPSVWRRFRLHIAIGQIF